MGDLQMGRSGAGPLQDTGFGGGDAGFGDALFKSLSMLRVYKGAPHKEGD
jgi:hypothetical protein